MRLVDDACFLRRHLPPRRGAAPGSRVSRVREVPPRYEDEGTLRIARGAVAVAGDAWWSIELAVPWSRTATGSARLRLRRHGASAGNDDGLELSVPVTELEALVTLVSGVVAQGRRDAVLDIPPAVDGADAGSR